MNVVKVPRSKVFLPNPEVDPATVAVHKLRFTVLDGAHLKQQHPAICSISHKFRLLLFGELFLHVSVNASAVAFALRLHFILNLVGIAEHLHGIVLVCGSIVSERRAQFVVGIPIHLVAAAAAVCKRRQKADGIRKGQCLLAHTPLLRFLRNLCRDKSLRLGEIIDARIALVPRFKAPLHRHGLIEETEDA